MTAPLYRIPDILRRMDEDYWSLDTISTCWPDRLAGSMDELEGLHDRLGKVIERVKRKDKANAA